MSELRYSRLERYAGFADTLPRWQESICAIVGLGGLGGGLAQQLVRLGVTKLVLVDRDIVSQENLGHQVLFTEEQAQAGVPKAHAAAETLAPVNSAVELAPLAAELSSQTAAELLEGVQLIFDGLDNYYTRLLLNDWALASGRPYFYAGVVRGELSARAVIPGITGCLRCLLDRPPAAGEVPTCAAEGVFPPLLGVANALQLDAANRYLAGRFSGADDVLYSMSVTDWRLRQLRLYGPDARCAACGGKYEYLDGTLAILARQSCSAGRVELQLSQPLDLAAVAGQLAGSGAFKLRQNRYCLVASGPEGSFTVFPNGRLILSGSDDEKALHRFAAEYLGV